MSAAVDAQQLACPATGANGLRLARACDSSKSSTSQLNYYHFFVREAVENSRITVPYVNTSDNLADFFTKPLAIRTFLALRSKIMNMTPETGGADAAQDAFQHGGVSHDSSVAMTARPAAVGAVTPKHNALSSDHVHSVSRRMQCNE